MEEVPSKGLQHHNLYHPDYLELISPFLCTLATVICSTIAILGPERRNSNHDGFIFRHRIPLWIMQIVLVILLSFTIKDLRGKKTYDVIPPPLRLLCSVGCSAPDHRARCSHSGHTKHRCVGHRLSLYTLVLFFTLKVLMMDPNNLFKSATFISAMIVNTISIIRSLFTFEERHTRPPTHEYTSNLLLYTSFSFLNAPIMNPALRKGSLDPSDIPDLTDYDSSEYLWDTFCSRRRKESSLLINILSVVYPSILYQGIFALFSSLLIFVAPLALECILWHTSKERGGEYLGYLLFSVEVALILLLIGPPVAAITANMNYNHGRHANIQIRAILQCLLYQKLLKLDVTAVPDGAGRVANLISTDISYILCFAVDWQYLWTPLLQVALCVHILLQILGVAALGGVAVMVLVARTK